LIFVGLRFRKYEALGNDYLVIDPRDWPDGSEAEKSGNGIRIFARYLQDAGYVKGSNGTIVTAGGNAFFQYLDLGAHRIRALSPAILHRL
jgi:diaminopimelate epimerase